MKKLLGNKITINIFLVVAIMFSVISSIAIISAIIQNLSFITTQFSFFPGLILTILCLFCVLITIQGYKTNRMKNVNFFKKHKWIVWLISFAVSGSLGVSIYNVYYRLFNTMFPQAIGIDQGAYWSQNAPFIYLSIFAIIMNLFASLMIVSIPEKSSL